MPNVVALEQTLSALRSFCRAAYCSKRLLDVMRSEHGLDLQMYFVYKASTTYAKHLEAHVQQLGYLLHQAARLLDQEFALQLKEVGLTPRQASVLMALSVQEPATPTQLAEGLGIDRATMSGLVARLSRDGWIAMRDNPADRRSHSLTLTDRACDALPRIHAASKRAQAHVLDGMEATDVSSLLRALTALTAQNPHEQEGSQQS
jgi:DNA-binding MarR family transcriptional regulator